MSAGKTAGALVTGALFRATGARALGRKLVRDYMGGDEGASTAAGMLLVQAGPRSLVPIEEALDSEPGAGGLVDVLSSIEDPAAESLLRRIADDPRHRAQGEASRALLDRARVDGRTAG